MEEDKPEVKKGAFCEYGGCNKRPSFGDEVKKYRWCAEHKRPGSKSYQGYFCERIGCGKYASYAIGESGRKRWCAKHKPKLAVLTAAARCIEEGCSRQPTFGLPGKKRSWCAKHKCEGAVNLTVRSCSSLGCTLKATFVHDRSQKRYCAAHAPDFCTEIQTRGVRTIDEIKDLLQYLKRQNIKLRKQVAVLRTFADPAKLEAWDKEMEQQDEKG